MDEHLKSIYYDPKHPASFSSPENLYQAAKKQYALTRKQVKDWLASQENYTLHKKLRRKFPRSRIFVDGVDSQWQGDLMDFSRLSQDNDGYKYVLLLIDVYSRYVWTAPMKNKTGAETLRALRHILDSTTRQMNVFVTDAGKEFLNKGVQDYLKEKSISHVIMRNETKAAYAERAIKTIKTKLFKYMTHQGSYRWIDALGDVNESYNHAKHRSLGRPPVEVTKDVEDESRLEQYFLKRKVKPINKFKFALGDVVRISRLKRPFERQYDETWTGELFTISKKYLRDGLPLYKLVDWNKEAIEGSFYEAELQKVKVDENTVYKIEKIVQKRKRKGKREVLVRWLHWPATFDSWLPETELQQHL